MLPKLERVWIVRRDHESILIPIRDEEAAKVYEEAGWLVVEIAEPEFDEDELRCLGVRLERRSDRDRQTPGPLCRTTRPPVDPPPQ